MMHQSTLQFEPSSRERFEKFHAANPHVYQLLAKYARELKAAGHDQCGIRLIWERCRYEEYIDKVGNLPAWDNNFTPYYSRLLMEREPDLRGFFRLRERK